MRPKNSKRMTLRLSPNLFERLEKLAGKTGDSINRIIREATVNHLDKIAPEKQ